MAEIDIKKDTLDRVMMHNRLKMMKFSLYWIIKTVYYNARIGINKVIMAVQHPRIEK